MLNACRLFTLCFVVVLSVGAAAAASPRHVRITIMRAAPPSNTFLPDEAFGAGLDGGSQGDTDRLYTPHNIAAMRSAGLRPVTYRLRTELGIEAWHWNPKGVWSDVKAEQGYWTSDDALGEPIMTSWGYNLPRRGDTFDNANNQGYSRLDDGDHDTFWKSNPYLDAHFTHDGGRPQWAVIALDERSAVDAVRIWWGNPYATHYDVQYWTGVDEYDPDGRWVVFPHGAITTGTGGDTTIKLSDRVIQTRFVRLLLNHQGFSSITSGDIRDQLGFAVREIALGRLNATGEFEDLIRHGKTRDAQTIMHVSSTDPWHRSVDRDPELEQPGLDRVFQGGLTNGLPMMVPVGVFYDTPDNAASLVRYLKRRAYPLTQVELGEEPDGQYVDAADYGALYLQAVDAIRAVDNQLVLGGPSLQNGVSDTWLDPDPDRSWTHHFIRYLKSRDRLADLGFFSFERYPYDDMCGDIGAKLRRQSQMLGDLMARLRQEEVPQDIPWIITEYGFSAYSGRAMVELPSALLDADMVAGFLAAGGDGAYMFGYGPNVPVNQHLACAGFGNMMLQIADRDGQAEQPMPAYYFARMLTRDWAQPTNQRHRIFPVRVSDASRQPKGGAAVTAYAVMRPDGQLSVMMVNRDAVRPASVHLRLAGRGFSRDLKGRLSRIQYSPANYRWAPRGEVGRPSRNLPPFRRALKSGHGAIILPPYSLTIVRGN